MQTIEKQSTISAEERFVLTEHGKFWMLSAEDAGLAEVYAESKSEMHKLAKAVRLMVQKRCTNCKHCGNGNWPTSGPPCMHPDSRHNGVAAPCKAVRVCPTGRQFTGEAQALRGAL